VASVTDKAGFSLSVAGILEIWHQALTAIVTAGSVGKLIKDYLDAAITSRNATTPPTANAIADQVWDELIAGHAGAGSTGAALSSATAPSAATIADAVWDEVLDTAHEVAGSASVLVQAAGGAADPLLNAVPATYASGTAGYVLGHLNGVDVTVVSPVAEDLTVTLYKGDDYNTTDGRALDWPNTAGSWPDLTGATIVFNMWNVEVTGSVVTPTGVGQKLRAQPTAAQTDSLNEGTYKYNVVATLATSNRVVTLAEGKLVVRA
jgi:hypothetical protein